MHSDPKAHESFRPRGWLDWCFAVFSFLVFLSLEGALLYAYFIFVGTL